MISNVVERYCHMASHDTLVCEFHQVMQRKLNTLRNFQECIEKMFKKLQRQIPERYPLSKDSLSHRMHQQLPKTSCGICTLKHQ